MLKRAILFLRRKKVKSLILLIVLSIIAIFVSISAEIKKTSDLSAKEIREAVGAKFRIQVDKSKSDNFQDNGNGLEYIGIPLDDKILNTILKDERIKNFNAAITNETFLYRSVGTHIELDKMNNKYDDDKIMRYLTTYEGNSNLDMNEYFTKNIFSLIKGEFIESGDKNVAVISSRLAEINGLDVGDTFVLADKDNKLKIKVVIKGIFDTKESQINAGMLAPGGLYQNRVFVDVQSAKELSQRETFNWIDCFIRDPADLNTILDKIEKDKIVDSNYFSVVTNDSEYKKLVNPLNALIKLMNNFLVVTILAGTIILSLILAFWIRERIHETGIYLSLGISKYTIISQYLLEVLIVSGVSSFIAIFFATVFNNTIIKKILYSYKTIDEYKDMDIYGNIMNEVGISFHSILGVIGIEVLIVIISIIIASIPILIMKPKKLLNTME